MAYKLFEYDSKEEQLYFLMHGLNGSRKVECNKWLKAKVKKVRDGSGDKYYQSGFHVFNCLEKQIVEYCKKFKLERLSGRELVLVNVCVAGNYWPKPTNSSVDLWEEIWVDKNSFLIRVAQVLEDSKND